MYSITQNGEPLNKNLYTIDKETKTFSSNEDNLVLDFSDEHGWTFNTGDNCTFDTGVGCTFDTSSDCTFDTSSDCTFKTGYKCVVVRRDVYEIIELEENRKIKLNEYGVKGFTYLEGLEEITIDKEITINGKTYVLKTK